MTVTILSHKRRGEGVELMSEQGPYQTPTPTQLLIFASSTLCCMPAANPSLC